MLCSNITLTEAIGANNQSKYGLRSKDCLAGFYLPKIRYYKSWTSKFFLHSWRSFNLPLYIRSFLFIRDNTNLFEEKLMIHYLLKYQPISFLKFHWSSVLKFSILTILYVHLLSGLKLNISVFKIRILRIKYNNIKIYNNIILSKYIII